MELYERLKTARIGAGFSTAKDAASRVGIPYGTYSGHEAGSRGIKREELELYARAFNVSLSWLAFGADDQARDEFGYAVLAGVVSSTGEIDLKNPDTSPDSEVKMPQLPIGKGNLLQIVVQVSGNALSGFAPDGSYIYIDGSINNLNASTEEMLERCFDTPSFCRLNSESGVRYIIGILRKNHKGSISVERYLLPTLLGVEVEAAMPVIAVVLPIFGDRMRNAVSSEVAVASEPPGRWNVPGF